MKQGVRDGRDTRDRKGNHPIPGSHIGIFTLGLFAFVSGCAEGRWVHPSKTEAQAQKDWEICKAEVLAGAEHQKDTMAGSINLSGCMQSKGYRYIEAQPPPEYPSADALAPR
jgi:hypothetical protein